MMKKQNVTVYFDGSCPICTREINVYRRRNENTVDYIDVSSCGEMVADDLQKRDAMTRFHVRSSDGTLVDGGDAFATLWRATPGFRSLGRVFQAPGLRTLANIGYDLFLKVRPSVQSIAHRFGVR